MIELGYMGRAFHVWHVWFSRSDLMHNPKRTKGLPDSTSRIKTGFASVPLGLLQQGRSVRSFFKMSLEMFFEPGHVIELRTTMKACQGLLQLLFIA